MMQYGSLITEKLQQKKERSLKNKKEFGQGLLFIILEMEDFVFLSEV